MTELTTHTPVAATRRDRWADTGPHPWRRYLARAFDNVVVGSILWFLIGTLAYVLSVEAGNWLIAALSSFYVILLGGAVRLVSMIPLQAAMISLTGTTPGKWLCGVRVLNKNGSRLSHNAALIRETKVWLVGYGAGLPFISLFALIQAFNAVQDNGVADWDDPDEVVVSHLPIDAGRAVLLALVVAVTVAITAWGFVAGVRVV